MLRLWLAVLVVLVAVNAKQPYSPADGDRCTTIITGKKAGTQGPMTTHTADCADCDFRMNKVPSKLHAKGSMRKVYEYKSNYPANVCEDRGETWKSSNLEGTKEQIETWSKESIITTLVPQVCITPCFWRLAYARLDEAFLHEITYVLRAMIDRRVQFLRAVKYLDLPSLQSSSLHLSSRY